MNNPELDPLVSAQAKPEVPLVRLELTIQEVNTVLAALQEMPHRVVDGVLRKVVAQAQAQFPQQPPRA